MTTYREMVFMILDELKMVSDDNHFQPEHVLFLLDKYRALVLSQKYKDIRKEIPESNYQTLCLTLERVHAIDGLPCEGEDYMRSVEEIPHMMLLGHRKVSSRDFFQGNFEYVNNERFKYTGNNKYLKHQIYSTIAPDSHLYLKGNSPQLYYLETVKLTGIYEDSVKAAELECSNTKEICDVMDMNYPVEEDLIPIIIESIVKELGAQKYQTEDKKNDASDDLANLAAYIKNQLSQGYRSPLYNEYNK